MHKDKYKNFEELSKYETEGKDFEIKVTKRDTSKFVIIAPHGGDIEFKTTQITLKIAGDNFSSYSFNGLKSEDNFKILHITSTNFDEPKCIKLITEHDIVIAVHGCKEGEGVFLGGKHNKLIAKFASALSNAGILNQTTGHGFGGTNNENICNKGITGEGVQFELTKSIRNKPEKLELFVKTVKDVLCKE